MTNIERVQTLNTARAGRLGILVVLFTIIYPFYASDAQDGNDTITDSSDAYQLKDVMVYAEKQQSQLQKTPLAVTAFDDDEILAATITRIPDLALYTPSLVMGNTGNFSFPEIFLRGVGTVDFSIGSDPSIGFYVDDIYVGRPGALFMDLFDIARIEVLRGPQGTLYGRNTIGGAINIVSKKPSSVVEGFHQLRLGNFDQIEANGSVSGPLIKDKLLGKFSYSYKDRDGFSKNIADDSYPGDVDSFGFKGSVWMFPDDNIDIQLRMDYAQDRPTGVAVKPLLTGSSILGGAFDAAVGQPVTVEFLGHVEPGDTYEVNHNTSSSENRDTWGLSSVITVDYDQLSLMSITSYRGLNFSIDDETDGLSLQLAEFIQDVEQEQFSQEFRLKTNDPDERLQWIAGAFFFLEDADDVNTVASQDLSILLGPGNYQTTNMAEIEARNFALYGQGTYALTDRLRGTIGLRYSYEEKAFEIERVTNDFAGLGVVGFPKTSQDDDWQALTPKVGIQFQQSDDLLFYGHISRGFKSGGFNSLEQAVEAPFDPEFLTAYEVGVKSNMFDRRLQLNAAAFYYDHTDLQVLTIIKGAGGLDQVVTTNAAEATSAGLEIELKSRPVRGLDITGSVSVLDTEYQDFVNGNGTDVSGNELKRTPSLSTNLVIQYTHPMNDAGRVIVRGEHQYQSRIYFTETNENALSQAGYHNINARISYESNDGRYAIGIFGKNLTDEETLSATVDLRNQLGTISRIFNPRRTFGIELTCRY